MDGLHASCTILDVVEHVGLPQRVVELFFLPFYSNRALPIPGAGHRVGANTRFFSFVMARALRGAGKVVFRCGCSLVADRDRQ